MHKALSAKGTETDRKQTTSAQKPSWTKRSTQHTEALTQIPLYTQLAWGNQPPPWVRSPSSPQGQSEEPVQLAPLQRNAVSEVPVEDEQIGQHLAAARSGGHALDEHAQHTLEQALETDMSSVRVHTDSNADRLAQAVNADAFTTGADIFFRTGMYHPRTVEGLHLLAHEATHVVQQAAGPVTGRPGADGITISDPGDRFEQAAEARATQIISEPAHIEQTTAGQQQLAALAPPQQTASAVQRISHSKEYKALTDEERGWADELRKEISDVKIRRKIYEKNERLMTSEEQNAVKELSKTPNGLAWLRYKEFLAYSVVEGYAEGTNFSDWEKNDAADRLQIASYQYSEGKKNTPGYWKGLSVNKEQAKIYGMDAKAWAETLTKTTERGDLNLLGTATFASGEGSRVEERDSAVTNILRRIFLVMQLGLTYLNKESGWKDWDKPVAVALSHGGRVNIRIPAVANAEDANAFWDWLTGGEEERADAQLELRKGRVDNIATHNLVIGANKPEEPGSGTFKETKGFKAAAGGKATGMKQFGMDLPVGGLGKLDINGNVILPDGSHGHLYIGYRPPTVEKDGGLLIGCETSGVEKTSVTGKYHGGSGGSSEFSPTGGAKADAITHKLGSMLVDLNELAKDDAAWMDKLNQLDEYIQSGIITAKHLARTREDFKAHEASLR